MVSHISPQFTVNSVVIQNGALHHCVGHIIKDPLLLKSDFTLVFKVTAGHLIYRSD